MGAFWRLDLFGLDFFLLWGGHLGQFDMASSHHGVCLLEGFLVVSDNDRWGLLG